MEIIYFLIGAVYLYSFIHSIFLQVKAYKERTTYEKVVTCVMFACTALLILSTMN